MLSGKEFISDYDENSEDIERWFSIKCPQKYRRFADLLQSNGEEPTWRRIKDLYRYDKRLIFNSFRYISFLEEYLRAIVVRFEGDTEESYQNWQEKNLSHLFKPVTELLREEKGEAYASEFSNNLDNVRVLRNHISHNRIILELDIDTVFNSLYNVLPEQYRTGFARDIVGCVNNLEISARWGWKSPRYVSVDLEFSTGGDKKGTPPEDRKCSIIQIGAVKVTDTQKECRQWHVRLIPGREYD